MIYERKSKMAKELTQEQKKALRMKKRKRLMIIRRIKVYGGLAALLAIVLYILCAFVFFKITAIEVVGLPDENGDFTKASAHYSVDEIINISGIKNGDSLVRVSKSKTEKTIERLLPFIGEVSVKKRFPSTVRLVISDTGAAFGVREAAGYTLLDRDYKVLGVYPTMPKGCSRLIGVSFKEAKVGEIAVFNDEQSENRINEIMTALETAQMQGLTRLDISNIANIKLVLSGNVTIVLGTISDLDKKLETCKKTMEAELLGNPEARIIIDVTDSERSYVRDNLGPLYEEQTEYDEEPESETNMVDDTAQGDDSNEEPKTKPPAVG